MIKNEIAKIDCDIIANGGHNCGWEAPDHDDFLKVRTKCGGKITVAFITAMRREVPIHDEVEVRAHFEAHQTYLKLVEDKKELIAKYKSAKEQERIKRVKIAEGMDKLNADLNLGPRSSSTHGARTSSLGIEDKLKRREQLREYKEKKLQLDSEMRSEKLKAENQIKERERRKREREMEEKRQMVEEFKYRKEMEKQRMQ